MQIKSIIIQEKHTESSHEIAAVYKNQHDQHRSLHAMVSFKPGDVISNFKAGITQNFATYLTIQTAPDTHITLIPEFLQYTNHSCNPTAFFDTTNHKLICLQPLEAGDEITFFYPSTEWEMAQPFVCNCGSKDCLQLINGAAHLTVQTLSKYRLTSFIKQQVMKKLAL